MPVAGVQRARYTFCFFLSSIRAFHSELRATLCRIARRLSLTLVQVASAVLAMVVAVAVAVTVAVAEYVAAVLARAGGVEAVGHRAKRVIRPW